MSSRCLLAPDMSPKSSAKFHAWSVSPQALICVPCCQPTKEIRCTERQENRGVWHASPEFARNLPGILSELGIRLENGPDWQIPQIKSAKKALKHKETHRMPPNSDPLLKFFIWGPLLLENKAEEATHIKNLGLHLGAPSFFMWVFLYVLFSLPSKPCGDRKCGARSPCKVVQVENRGNFRMEKGLRCKGALRDCNASPDQPRAELSGPGGHGDPKNLLRLFLGDRPQRLKYPENPKIILKMANLHLVLQYIF